MILKVCEEDYCFLPLKKNFHLFKVRGNSNFSIVDNWAVIVSFLAALAKTLFSLNVLESTFRKPLACMHNRIGGVLKRQILQDIKFRAIIGCLYIKVGSRQKFCP